MGTIAEKLNYSINVTNDIAERINYLGGNITSETELADFKDELDSVYAKLPKVTNSTASSSVTLNPTLKGRIDSTLKGQIGQDTTNGDNILKITDYTNLSLTANANATVTKNRDKIIIATTADNSSGAYLYKSSFNNIIKDYDSTNTYYLSADVTFSNNTTFKFGKEGASSVSYSAGKHHIESSFINETLVFYTYGTVTTITMENIMIAETANKDYEPYTNGASPNPNYEQAVKCTTGENNVKVKSAQLVDFASKTDTGYSFTNDTLVFESSPGAYTMVQFDITDTVKNNPGKKLKFSYESIDISNQAGTIVSIGIGYNDGTPAIYRQMLGHDLTNISYQIASDTSNISAVSFRVFANGTLDTTSSHSITIVKPQLQFGETALPYSKYGTPQEKELDLESYNKFDKNNANIINAYINSVNKVIENNNNARTIIFPCKPNTTYTTSKIASQRFIIGTAENYTIGTICSTMSADFTATKKTVTTTQNDHYLIIYFYLSTVDTLTEQEILNSIQIVEGSTEKPYQAYYHYEVYENGYFSKENGKWYLNNEYGKIENPSSVWNNVEQSGIYYRIPLDGLSIKSIGAIRQADVLCNKFRASTTNDYNICFHYSNRIFFYLPEGMTTKEEFLTLVSGMYIVYPLATPSKTEIINTTLINQLEEIYKLMSYDGTTIIETECENGNMPIIISARALKGE